MDSFLLQLVRYVLRDVIWNYLSIKDICQILILNKNHRIIFLDINRSLSNHNITLDIVQYTVKDQCKIITSMLKSFPKIYSLHLQWKYVYNFKNNVMDYDSMSILYNTQSLYNSLNEIKIMLINDSGIVGISNFTNLRILDIQDSPITSHSLEEISLMINIKSLNLRNCSNISEEGFYYLNKLSNLVELDISFCELSNDVLENLSSLTNLVYFKLEFCSNFDGITGVNYLSNLINLDYLNLSSCFSITNLSFLTPLIKISTLRLSNCEFLEDNLNVSPISYLTNITYLDLSYCSLLTNRSINCLSCLTNLTSLNIQGIRKLTDLYSLNSLVKLECLDVSESLITNIDMFTISHLTKLKELRLINCVNLTNDAYDHLKSFDHIKLLSEDTKGDDDEYFDKFYFYSK